jgi:putative transposase
VEHAFVVMAGHARFAWNKALRLNLDRLARGVPIMRYADLCGLLRLWKRSNEYGWLAEAHSQVLQQKLRDLDRTFADAFDPAQPRKRLPRFKRRGRDDSFRFPQDVTVDNRRVYLPKIGFVPFFKSRTSLGTIKQATVTREADGW